MLEPWETLLWMAILLVLLYFVLSACFLNPDSVCRAGLASARRTLAAQGGQRGWGARRHGEQRRSVCMQCAAGAPLFCRHVLHDVGLRADACLLPRLMAAGAKLLAYRQ